MGAAAALVHQERETEQARLARLMARLQQALADLPDLLWVGAQAPRVPGIVNVAVQGVAGEALLASLWGAVSASAGSACTAAEGEPSAVLQALGLDPVTAQGALRLSPGRWTREAEIDQAAAVLRRTILRLRRVAAGESVDDLPGPAALPPVYGAAVTAWFGHLRGAGRLSPGPGVVTGEAGAPRLGRWVRWDLAVRAGRIERACFSAWGCPATLAVAAWTAQWLEGRDLVAAGALTGAQMAEALDLAGARRGVALTVEDALRAALAAQHGAGMSTQSVRSELCRN
jgi:cysteine desulfurase